MSALARFATGLRDGAMKRIRNRRCRACGEWSSRRLPNCPTCKTPFDGSGLSITPPPNPYR